MDFERSKRHVQEINLTALIDIVFHLLVFVMLTTTFVVTESIELSLPSTAASRAEVRPSPLRIEIQSDGSVHVGQQSMNLEQLTNMLADRLGDAPDTRVVIYTNMGVSVQQLIRVMDAVYLTGGRSVQVDKAG